jgi:uncharacterized protein YbjT (DUF2867 family)
MSEKHWFSRVSSRVFTTHCGWLKTRQTVRCPSAFIQPILSDDVFAALVDVTLGAPVNGIIDLAGPERFRFDEIIRRFLSATRDTRQVLTNMHAHYFGAKLDEQSLMPRGPSQIGATRFEDWLSHSPTSPAEFLVIDFGNRRAPPVENP